MTEQIEIISDATKVTNVDIAENNSVLFDLLRMLPSS